MLSSFYWFTILGFNSSNLISVGFDFKTVEISCHVKPKNIRFKAVKFYSDEIFSFASEKYFLSGDIFNFAEDIFSLADEMNFVSGDIFFFSGQMFRLTTHISNSAEHIFNSAEHISNSSEDISNISGDIFNSSGEK